MGPTNQPRNERDPMDLPIKQPAPAFSKSAYTYFTDADELPTYDEMTSSDPIARVRLFLPNSRFAYYVTALTDYSGTAVMTGFCVSPLGSDFDEGGDMAVHELLTLRDPLFQSLPIERDITWEPKPLSEVRQEVPA